MYACDQQAYRVVLLVNVIEYDPDEHVVDVPQPVKFHPVLDNPEGRAQTDPYMQVIDPSTLPVPPFLFKVMVKEIPVQAPDIFVPEPV